MSAADLTCLCGFKVRIEAGPDAQGLARNIAVDVMDEHQDRCRRCRPILQRKHQEEPDETDRDLFNAVRLLHQEIICRIDHGAESGMHLNYVRDRIAEILEAFSAE